jgi:hypothetical protein
VAQTGWDRLTAAWPTVREMILLGLGAWWGYLTVTDPGPVDWGNVSITAGCLGIGLAWRKDERRPRPDPAASPGDPSQNGQVGYDEGRKSSEPG